MDNEFATNLRKNAFDLWITPEVERRRASGTWADDVQVHSAQVIIQPTGETSVRLNEEVQGHVRLKPEASVTPGAALSRAELNDVLPHVAQFHLLKDDNPNAAHLTLLGHERGWFISFDFRYNGSRIAEHLAACREFLDAAAVCLSDGRLRAFIANLHVATELAAKGVLLQHPDKRLLESRKHEFLHRQYNLYAKRGNSDLRFARLLNRLAELRNPARYLSEPFDLAKSEAKSMLEVAEEMFGRLKEIAPERLSVETPQGGA